jgi:hypothetical protein
VTTKRLHARSRGAGNYDLLLDGTYIGNLYQDWSTPNDPWRFSPAIGARVPYPWSAVNGPYPTKRDALAALTVSLVR